MSLGNPSDLCGFIGDACLYRVSIPIDAYHRLVTLSIEGVEGLPDWIDFGFDSAVGRRKIATTDPSYFDNQKETRNANTGRDQAGFTQL